MQIIAAVKTEQEFEKALTSQVGMIFDLSPNLMRMADRIQRVHTAGKRLFAHMDFAEGIGKDRCGIDYMKQLGIDGIISTRVNIIKAARESGLCTVQRFFIVDSHSVDTTVESLKSSKADMIEVMPGVVPKIIRALRERIFVPIIAGGLIENPQEVADARENGAFGISTGKELLWKGEE